MARIIISGCSCSGKSTLAAKLSKELNIKHIQLDALNWKENWVERDPKDFLNRIEDQVVNHRSWIIDGNYSRSHSISWPLADAVIWLNYPFFLVFSRALRRTFRRVFTQEELYSGNRESFRRAFMSHDSILLWVLITHRSHRRRYSKIMEAERKKGKLVIELRKPQELEEIIGQLAAGGILDQETPARGV